MPGITKSHATIFSPQVVTGNTVVTSSTVAVDTKIAATVFIHFAGIDTSGALWEGVEFRIEASPTPLIADQWYPLITYKTATAPPVTATVSSCTANQLTVTAASQYLLPNNVILLRNSTIGSSEWHRIIGANIPGGVGTITLLDTPATTTGWTMLYNLAETFTAQLDLAAITALRLVVDACNSHLDTAMAAYITTGDSIG